MITLFRKVVVCWLILATCCVLVAKPLPDFIQPMLTPKPVPVMPVALTVAKPERPKVLLIIDDIGDNYRLGKRVIDLPVTVNLAFLPRTPFARRLAQAGYQLGHEVMLHLPMESTTRKDLLREEALTQSLSESELRQKFFENLSDIPHVRGFNNHMGSLLTTLPQQMEWVMAFAAERQLYFVDSRTSSQSVALQQASEQGLRAVGRDIFLDPVGDQASVEKQLNKALALADKRGVVVMIGHPYRDTLDVLERRLPQLRKDYQFVSLTSYLNQTSTLAKESQAQQRDLKTLK